MTRISLIGALAGAILLSPLAQAQEIDPGLWESTQEFRLGGQLAAQQQEILAELKNMPPAARQMMEEQMARMGVQLNPDGGTRMAVKLCVSPEEARQAVIREGQREGDCTFTKVRQQGNSWNGEVVCDGEDFKGHGTFTTTAHDRHHYTTKADINSAGQGSFKMKMDARWLAADCGELGKPN